MFCSKCGNKIEEGTKFCNKCGNKIENETVDTKKENNDIDEYGFRLGLANNEAKKFLEKKKHTLYEYNQICKLYGRVEEIGEHKNTTYIDEMNFFIKANMLDDGIFFYTVEKFEQVYDNLIDSIILSTKDDKEKEQLKLKFNKEKTLREFEEKLKIKKKKSNKPYKIMLIISVVVLCIPFITSILTMTNKKVNYKESNYSNSIDTNTTINVQYGDTNYENEIYGEKVVEAYVSKYGAIKNIGKLNSITKSEFLEKDNYGRYAFRVTFNYNPIDIDKAGTVFLNNQEAIKTVIAIYILNLDNPGGIYVGTENVIETDYAKWEQMKNYKNLCYGAWNTPLTIKFSD